VRHLGPQLLPGRTLLGGQLRQGFLIADTCQVGVGLPVPQALPYGRAGLGLVALSLLGPDGQVSFQPVEGLLPQAGTLLVFQLTGVLAPATASQGSGTGRIVAMPLLGESGTSGEVGQGFGVKTDGGGVQLLEGFLTQLCQLQSLRVVGRL